MPEDSSEGALLFIEAMRDVDPHLPIANMGDFRVGAAPHEVAHQFGLLGDTDIGAPGLPTGQPDYGIMSYRSRIGRVFVPAHLHMLRCRRSSPVHP